MDTPPRAPRSVRRPSHLMPFCSLSLVLCCPPFFDSSVCLSLPLTCMTLSAARTSPPNTIGRREIHCSAGDYGGTKYARYVYDERVARSQTAFLSSRRRAAGYRLDALWSEWTVWALSSWHRGGSLALSRPSRRTLRPHGLHGRREPSAGPAPRANPRCMAGCTEFHQAEAAHAVARRTGMCPLLLSANSPPPEFRLEAFSAAYQLRLVATRVDFLRPFNHGWVAGALFSPFMTPYPVLRTFAQNL